MGPSARAIAEQASFQAFLHCYLSVRMPGLRQRLSASSRGLAALAWLLERFLLWKTGG